MVSLANGKCPVVVPRLKSFGRGRRRSPAAARPAVRSRRPRDARRGAGRARSGAGRRAATGRDRPERELARGRSHELPRARDPASAGARTRMTPAEQRASDGIGSRILSGLAWKAGSQITLQITRMAVALVLARLLAPHDWGLAAMVLVFSGFVVVFTDNALGTALIQRRDLRAGDRSTVFWVSAGVGLVLTLAGIALRRPSGRLLRRAGRALAVRGALGRVPRQRSRHDPDGAARARDGVPAARAAPDRGHARRRGRRNHDRRRSTAAPGRSSASCSPRRASRRSSCGC